MHPIRVLFAQCTVCFDARTNVSSCAQTSDTFFVLMFVRRRTSLKPKHGGCTKVDADRLHVRLGT